MKTWFQTLLSYQACAFWGSPLSLSDESGYLELASGSYNSVLLNAVCSLIHKDATHGTPMEMVTHHMLSYTHTSMTLLHKLLCKA